MRSLNNVQLIGNLGKDPEIKILPNGTKCAVMSIATTEVRQDENGDFKTLTDWHQVETYGKRADKIEQYAKKGDKIYVDGSLKSRSWTDGDGVERLYVYVRLDNFMHLQTAAPKPKEELLNQDNG
jgi:single-strand DNA-binding protein